MNATVFTPEEISEIKKLLKQADEAIINNVYAKNKIQESLEKLNKTRSLLLGTFKIMENTKIDYKLEYWNIQEAVAKMLVDNRNAITPLKPHELLSKWYKIRELK